ncbi:STE3-like pheromone receptor [Macrolepiota fuliginosa MF-IS2]|uniref:STE3-like pheromone receptor n=1 Tax=Macrolepiota fuliginosa MF-IS2 TaxID=1400762 RepID=A0A9P5X005_9AGAR|nr:STE3-like pheromone receptor [Macrolepiota fuliginosa MF-IS2]
MSPILYPELAPIALLSSFLLLIPLPWHWRARNVATLSIILWLFIANITYAVDAIIWKDNVALIAKVWCDITTKLIIGINFALPAACLCICVHLEHVASARPGPMFIADKRRRRTFEAILCFGLPVVFMALHYVVQGHRFDVFQGYGCRPSNYFSVPALFIIWIPPLAIATIAMVYSALALRHFLIRRLTFASILNSKSGLTTSRYVRLMLMSTFQMIWSISITIYTLSFTMQHMTLRKWTTWADVHSNFSRIDQYPIMLMPESVARGYYVGWWVIPISSWLFIAFFAFGRDAIEEYKKCGLWVRAQFLRLSPSRYGAPHKKGFVDLANPR